MEVLTRSEAETEALGERLARCLTESDVVYLIGDLGSGKTCLTRGLARGLGALEREVASPTFAILHEYAGSDGHIVLRHLDLYRLRDTAKELAPLGLPESVRQAPVAVEWPGQAIRGVLAPTVEIAITVVPGESRAIRIEGRELPLPD